uniref:Polyunsaturated fatty acid lipoxygenase ALOX15 n=1 Tax=Catagonus wagneri TaxID=51154 RepID=A0A8C3WK49_9CETA
MSKYCVRVATGTFLDSGTWDNVSVSLVGPAGESPALPLDNFGKDFSRGAVKDFEVTAPQDVGPVLLLRVHKAPRELPLPLRPSIPDAWFCRWLQLTPPQGAPLRFPCYQWLEGVRSLVLREGTGEAGHRLDGSQCGGGRGPGEVPQGVVQPLAPHCVCIAALSRWSEYFPGIPRCLAAESLKELDPNLRYSITKEITQNIHFISPPGSSERWQCRRQGWHQGDPLHASPPAEYVFEHWQEDAFFAYQFLNGLNPVLIRRCRCLPENFPVTDAMVAPVLGPGTSLQAELESGSLYLVDHAILSGLRSSDINGRPQFVAAPLTLLHQRPGGPLLPLAIQLTQIPGPDSPIFLPSDSAEDWLLAKTWVRNSEFLVHEMVTHLLRTHFVMEAFFVSLLRQLPMCHPIFKLLLPHFRYTIYINIQARTDLFAPGKLLDQVTSLGRLGSLELMARALEAVTYRSLCLPHQLADRDIQDLAHYYYRDDALRIWAAIESFVSEIVGIYYPDDSAVSRDVELQAWVREIFQQGFLSCASSGVPSSLDSCAGLIEYLTMVIFNCSAQHAAVNSGQFDFSAWMPNVPTTMRLPPPTSKGQTSLVASLPEVNATCHTLVFFRGISNETKDTRRLGTYPDEHFTEEAPQRSIATFQSRLAQVSRDIRERNRDLELPYTYLDPTVVENSIAV